MGTRRGGGRVRDQIFRRSSLGRCVKWGKDNAGFEVDGDGGEVDVRFGDDNEEG